MSEEAKVKEDKEYKEDELYYLVHNKGEWLCEKSAFCRHTRIFSF